MHNIQINQWNLYKYPLETQLEYLTTHNEPSLSGYALTDLMEYAAYTENNPKLINIYRKKSKNTNLSKDTYFVLYATVSSMRDWLIYRTTIESDTVY